MVCESFLTTIRNVNATRHHHFLVFSLEVYSLLLKSHSLSTAWKNLSGIERSVCASYVNFIWKFLKLFFPVAELLLVLPLQVRPVSV